MKYLALVLLIINLSFANNFLECYKLFKEEKFFKAKRCFLEIKDSSLKSYTDYFLSQIALIYDEIPVLPKKNDYAVNSYIYLKLSGDNFYKKNYEKAKYYLKKIDKKALDIEDIPFYLYLKSNLYNDFNLKKQLATKYIYNRYYGYKTFLKIYNKLSKEEIQKAVDILISKRMYKRALAIIPLLKTSNKTLYYLIYLNVKTKNTDKAKKLLQLINKNSKWYAVSLYILGYYSKTWEERKKYFHMLLKTDNQKYIQKLANYLMKKAFHYKKISYFLYYRRYLPKNEDKVWYTFLYKYFFISKKEAFKYLNTNKIFIKDENKLNYWLYLTSNNKIYFNRIKYSKNTNFYYIIADNRPKLKPLKLVKITNIKDKLFKILKADGKLYRWAYVEGIYLYKKTKNIHFLYKTVPETIVRYLPKEKRYIKPFGELKPLIYATMKQESLFYYRAVSFSNAVGLMQFIPSTAYWAAKKRKDMDFDITDMFNPYVSIDYGRWYLDYLLKKFNGNVFYAIAAYNGGWRNVKRTIKRFNPKNIAEFVETHPFNETRNYVKKVYTNYAIYKNGVKNVYRAN